MHQRLEKHGINKCSPSLDVDSWPAPNKAIEAGLTPEEWAAFAKNSWNQYWSGGEDGTILTAIGSITPEQNKQMGDACRAFAEKVTDYIIRQKS